MLEFLVTAQGYEKNDPYKQTILLHDVFSAEDQGQATSLFNKQFQDTHHIMKIYSILDITSNRV